MLQFMPMQKFMCKFEWLDTPDAFEPTGLLTISAAQFTWIFVENGTGQNKTVTEALKVYESVHEALPTRWSPIHLFKCLPPVSHMHSVHMSCWRVW